MLIDSIAAVSEPRQPRLLGCFECADLGFTLATGGFVNACWRAKAGVNHAFPSPAAVILRASAQYLRERGIVAVPHDFQVARQIARGTSANPVRRSALVEGNFAFGSAIPLRLFHECVERLRRVWLLPVGSRKSVPAGYWIITDADDFFAWAARYKSSPLTQLETLGRVTRRNFPVLVGQLGLDFIGAEGTE